MRITATKLATLAALLIGAACAEPTAAPTANQRSLKPEGQAPAFNFAAAGAIGLSYRDFDLSPAGGTYQVGLFTLTVPANAVCDPAQSTYGPSEWDKPCVTLNSPLHVHAAVQLTATGLAVDFQPSLRFSPAQQVRLSTDMFAPIIVANRNFFANNHSLLRALAVYYSPTLGAGRVADFQSDPSVITHVDLSTGTIWRRVKHFSGYVYGSGEPCTPGPDNPDCVEVDGVQ
ncbi:MAG TPA: hypothetical protein VHB25_01785 [Gemmatimonadaceae bacterium]|nr:hypothetical protein [Gemmatimonadaceae bacterium]